jgi:hypothetical protein
LVGAIDSRDDDLPLSLAVQHCAKVRGDERFVYSGGKSI